MSEVAEKLRYLWVNSVQVAYDGASFIDVRAILEWKVGGRFDIYAAITKSVSRILKTVFKFIFS